MSYQTPLNDGVVTIYAVKNSAAPGNTPVDSLEKKGVLRDEKDDESVIPEIDFSLFQEYRGKGIIQGGMIPKLENAFEAIRHGVCEVIITRADCIGQKDRGTRIVG